MASGFTNSVEDGKIKKKILLNILILLLLLWSNQLKAAPTTASQAEKAVRGWLKVDARPLGTSLGQQIAHTEVFFDANEEPIYYAVYLQPSGFVIVSANDLVEPIIAFVNDGRYDPSLDNPLGALVSRDVFGRIAVMRDFEKIAESQSKKKDLTGRHTTFKNTSAKAYNKWNELQAYADMSTMQTLGLSGISDVRVVPLIQSKWNQGSECGYYCYNYYTPNHYYSGCVATAFAQLMRFHEYPVAGIGVHPFTIKVNGVSQTAYTRGGNGTGGPYNWNVMVLDPSCSNYTNDRWKGIGSLCYDVGVAAQAEYASGGTNIYQIRAANALRNTFLYSNAICTDYWSEIIGAELIKMLNTNLDANLPAILSITTAAYGHSVLCDGYGFNGATLYHHINMGNSGTDDVWYNLPDVGIYDTVAACTYNVFKQHSGEIISGNVVNSDGNPIGAALVTAQGTGGPYTTTTNSKGIYALIGVCSGSTYNLGVAKAGYEFTSKNVAVGTSQNGARECGNLWGVNFQGNIVPTLSYIEISGPIEVDENYGAQYTCTAHYSDNSAANVTSNAIWSDNSSYAFISSSGYLTTSFVCSDQLYQITTTYADTSDNHDVIIKSMELAEGMDLNGDNIINLGDFAIFSGYWMEDNCSEQIPCGYIDCDKNGIVNFIDLMNVIENWLWEKYPPYAKDLYNDGKINFRDFSILASYWNDSVCSSPDWCEGSDFDESGYVDSKDLLIFVEDWLWED